MARGNPCAPGRTSPGGTVGTTIFVDEKPTARTSAQVVLSVKGCKFPEAIYQALLEEITIEETTGLMMSMMVVKLANPHPAITDDAVWEEGAEMSVETGFPLTGLTKRHGKFYLMQPRASFGPKSTIVLVGFGEEVKLGLTEKRRAFRKKADSDIVKEIAGEHGFDSDVEDTQPVHDQVLQANENDYKFLARRALLHGFQIFLQDGVLHFHKPRFEDSGVALAFEAGQQSSLSAFDVETRTFLRGAEWKVTQVDPLKLDIVDEVSKDDVDPVTKDMIAGVRGPRKWPELVSGVGGIRPMRFGVNIGHLQALGPLKEQVQALAESQRYVVAGRGSTFGLDQLRTNQAIEVMGMGKHSGKYFLTKVIHRIVGGSYSVDFEVVRSFTGGSSGSGCTPKVVESKRAGVVDLAV